MNPDHDRIGIELRRELDTYVPDRASIAELAAIRRRAAERQSRFRPAVAGAGVAAVLALVAVAAWSSGDEPAPRPALPQIAAAPTTAAPTRSASPPPASVRSRWLSTTGSIDKNSVATWTQNTVTVRSRARAAHFIMTITVARTFDARRAGLYSTAPNNDISASVDVTPTSLIYRYELKAGASLAPGTWIFGAQFDHRSGRHRDADSYAVDARSADGAVHDSGDFTGN
jgi:hypothetical protein